MFPKLAAIALLASTAIAQIPDGHFVVSTFYYSGSPGGLWVVDPRTPETPRPIRNLPQDLTGFTTTIFSHGANCVKILPDGRLVVGEMEHRHTAPAELFLLTLRGLEAVDYERISIGAGTISAASIDEILLLPNGDLLVSGQSSLGVLFRVSPATRSVTPIQVTGLQQTAFVSGIGLDPTGSTLYITDAVTPHQIRKVSVNGGASELVGPAGQHGLMAVDHEGQLVLPIVATTPRIDRMDPATGDVTTVGLSGGNVNGIQIEPATGMIVFMTNGYNGPANHVRLMDPQTGLYSELAVAPGGFASGVAVAPAPAVYGTGTPGAESYGWHIGPGTGGLPRAGNASFAVEVSTTGASAGGALLAAAGSANVPVLGIALMLDPATLATVGPIPASGRVGLPIPGVPALVGRQLFLQGVHFDAGAPMGLAATPGLRVSVLR